MAKQIKKHTNSGLLPIKRYRETLIAIQRRLNEINRVENLNDKTYHANIALKIIDGELILYPEE